MSPNQRLNSRPPAVRGLVSFGGRMAVRTLRPFGGAFSAAAGAGIDLERRTLERVLDSDELERSVMAALSNRHLQRVARRAMASQGAAELVDGLFDSGLFDHVIDRLLSSQALWRLVDEVAQSPAVMAAVSQQSLGFADQLGDELRSRSRRADGRLERLTQRIVHSRASSPAATPSSNSGDDPADAVNHRS